MIKILLIVVAIGIFSCINATKDNAISTKEKINNNLQKATVPENVKAIFDKSCIACHSNAGNMAKMHVNFDKIYTNSYSPKTMSKKLKNINRVITRDIMPSKRYLKKFPDKALTDKDKKLVSDWINSELKKYNK